MDWLDDTGLIILPSGPRIRGRRLTADASPADFALVLAEGPRPEWAHRVIQWPDFGTPKNLDDARRRVRVGAPRVPPEGIETLGNGGGWRSAVARASARPAPFIE